MAKLIYIACSSFSGSTLISFLLNLHPDIFTVGHMTGWRYGADSEFRCSCGARLHECPFFRHIAHSFRENGLPFDFTNFGTEYRLAESQLPNRYLTAGLPLIDNTTLERIRDGFIRLHPGFSRTLARQDRANLTFIESALSYAGASVFVDNSHSPHRLRHLRRVLGLEITVVHLIRDFRGVALSNMELRSWDPAVAVQYWLRQQSNIIRIACEFRATLRVLYEVLCSETDTTLFHIHRCLGLPAHPYSGDFKSSEHHILGNVMRMGAPNIVQNARWQRELSAKDRSKIERTALAFVSRNSQDPLSAIIRHYLDTA